MVILQTAPPALKTLADLLDRLGGVPLDRIRFRPFPGTATIQDVIEIQDREGRLCELVEGVLVEKPMGYTESSLTVYLLTFLNVFVLSRNLGLVTGPDGTVELMDDLVRIPDVAFTSWDRMPDGRRPASPVPRLAPNLAVEVWSKSNPPGEKVAKRKDYFAAGVDLVWEIDPVTRTIEVYTSVDDVTILSDGNVLDGGSVLPEFTLAVRDLFAELDRQR